MEAQEGGRLIQLIQRYEELRGLKDELSDAKSEIEEEFKAIQTRIVEQMVEDDIPRQGYQGYTYSPQTVTHYGFRAEEELAAEGKDKIAIMRANGYGDLIRETINQRSLESRMKGDARTEDGIPEEVMGILSSYDEMRVNRRKTTERAMRQAKDAVARARKAQMR